MTYDYIFRLKLETGDLVEIEDACGNTFICVFLKSLLDCEWCDHERGYCVKRFWFMYKNEQTILGFPYKCRVIYHFDQTYEI